MLHCEENVEGSAQGEQAEQRIALERELNALKLRARDIADIVSSVAQQDGEGNQNQGKKPLKKAQIN